MNKFNVGDKVKYKEDAVEMPAREVVSYTVTKDRVSYVITAKSFDPKTETVTEGVLHCTEEELTLADVEEKGVPNE